GDRQLQRSRQEAAGREGGVSQRVRVLERVGASDGGGDEYRANDRSEGRCGDREGTCEVSRDAGQVDSDHPGRAGAGWLFADSVHPGPNRRGGGTNREPREWVWACVAGES